MRRFLLVGWLLAQIGSTAFGESLPSFSLAEAAILATDTVVVEAGKIVEVWKGDLKAGNPWLEDRDTTPREVRHELTGGDLKQIQMELRQRGLNFVTKVTGHRQVLFRYRDGVEKLPMSAGAQWVVDRQQKRRHLAKWPAYATVWIEHGQAFAEQQVMNPGPTAIIPIDEVLWQPQTETYENVSLTESQLKEAFLAWVEIDREFLPSRGETNPEKRTSKLLDLLRPEDHRRTMFVDAALSHTPQLWAMAKPRFLSERYHEVHAELARVVYNRAAESQRKEILATFEQLLARPAPAETDRQKQRREQHRRQALERYVAEWKRGR